MTTGRINQVAIAGKPTLTRRFFFGATASSACAPGRQTTQKSVFFGRLALAIIKNRGAPLRKPSERNPAKEQAAFQVARLDQ